MSRVSSVVYYYSVCSCPLFQTRDLFPSLYFVYKVACSHWNAKWWPLARNMIVLKKWKLLLWLQVAGFTVIITGFLHLALEGYHHGSRLPANTPPPRVLVAVLLSHVSEFCIGGGGHAYSIWSENTVKKNRVEGLNYSQLISITQLINCMEVI